MVFIQTPEPLTHMELLLQLLDEVDDLLGPLLAFASLGVVAFFAALLSVAVAATVVLATPLGFLAVILLAPLPLWCCEQSGRALRSLRDQLPLRIAVARND